MKLTRELSDGTPNAGYSTLSTGVGLLPHCSSIDYLLIIPRTAPAQPADLVARLITDLKNRDAMVRRVAVVTLGGIGPRAKEAIPALIAALKDDDPGVRQTAAGALGGIGPEAKEAIPALISALKDGDPGVRTDSGRSPGGNRPGG